LPRYDDAPQPCPSRRGILIGALALAALPPRLHAQSANPTGVPPNGRLVFNVSRNGSPIGTHALSFSVQGNTLTVSIEVALKVGLGFITLYRYRHEAEERWVDGRFVSLRSKTDDNGTRLQVDARRTPSGVVIQTGTGPEALAPVVARPFTHWAAGDARTKLFNPQNGQLIAQPLVPTGPGTVALANGQSITATGFSLAGREPLRDWYDAATVWAALDGRGKDGSSITYRRW